VNFSFMINMMSCTTL